MHILKMDKDLFGELSEGGALVKSVWLSLKTGNRAGVKPKLMFMIFVYTGLHQGLAR